MKLAIRITLLAVLLGTTFTSQAQRGKNAEQVELPAFPMENEKVVYSAVVEAEGTQAELYAKLNAWFKSHYKNPSDVIQEQDEGSGTMLGKHRFPVYAKDPKTGQEIRGPLMLYTIKVMCKDGRFKYDVIEIKQKASTNIPLEDLIVNHRKKYEQAKAEHLVQVNDHITAVIYDLKKAMTAAPAAKKEDW